MSKPRQKNVEKFVGEKIVGFHQARLARIQNINLHDVLKKKNPYLFRAKNLLTSHELIASILEAFVSSSEEELFGEFLEEIAIYVSQQSYGGRKSSAAGIDLEFDRQGIRYIVAVKSGPAWGNSGQYKALERCFRDATKVLRQSQSSKHVQAILGICYGKQRTTDRGLYQKITGQNFWEFISGNENLYTDLIEPIGREAARHFEMYMEEKNKLYNRFTKEFLDEFCGASGVIDWEKLVAFNSGNKNPSTRPLRHRKP